MTHRLAIAVLIPALAAIGSPASAQEDYKARQWVGSCASCHGTDGRSNSEMPALAGRSRADLANMLREFKADKRKSATIMHQHAKGLTDDQIDRIAEYYSKQKK